MNIDISLKYFLFYILFVSLPYDSGGFSFLNLNH